MYSPEPAPEVKVTIERDGPNLLVKNPGQPGSTLFAESETRFRIAPDRGQVSFHLADDGTVEGLTQHKQVDVFAKRVGD